MQTIFSRIPQTITKVIFSVISVSDLIDVFCFYDKMIMVSFIMHFILISIIFSNVGNVSHAFDFTGNFIYCLRTLIS